MSKAADAFRTISEVADELEVPKHVLRFWEAKFSHIRPMKRGGGRRYYRPEDLELLRGIRHLLHLEGFTIKGVQKILREQGADGVKRWGRTDGEVGVNVVPPAMVPQMVPAAHGTLAAKTGSRRRVKADDLDAARGKAVKVAFPPETVASIRTAIAELERCRDILRGVTGPSVAETRASHARRAR